MSSNLQKQIELQEFIDFYNRLPSKAARTFLSEHIKQKGIKPSQIAKDLNISTHTIYAITKKYETSFKPTFEMYLKICNYLGIEILNFETRGE